MICPKCGTEMNHHADKIDYAAENEPIDTATFIASDVSTSTSTAGGTKTVAITEIAPNNGTTFNIAVGGMTTAGSVVATIPAPGRALR